MKYKKSFVMSKYTTYECLLEAKVKYLEAEVDNALLRLHQCKRRNREDKVKLRKIIETLEEDINYLDAYCDSLSESLYNNDDD